MSVCTVTNVLRERRDHTDTAERSLFSIEREHYCSLNFPLQLLFQAARVRRRQEGPQAYTTVKQKGDREILKGEKAFQVELIN